MPTSAFRLADGSLPGSLARPSTLSHGLRRLAFWPEPRLAPGSWRVNDHRCGRAARPRSSSAARLAPAPVNGCPCVVRPPPPPPTTATARCAAPRVRAFVSQARDWANSAHVVVCATNPSSPLLPRNDIAALRSTDAPSATVNHWRRLNALRHCRLTEGGVRRRREQRSLARHDVVKHRLASPTIIGLAGVRGSVRRKRIRAEDRETLAQSFNRRGGVESTWSERIARQVSVKQRTYRSPTRHDSIVAAMTRLLAGDGVRQPARQPNTRQAERRSAMISR